MLWAMGGLRSDEENKYKFVPPAFVSAFEQAVESMRRVEENDSVMSFADLEDLSHRQDVRQKMLEDWWHQSDVLLLCCCDEATASSALFAVRKAPTSVRFYEVGQ